MDMEAFHVSMRWDSKNWEASKEKRRRKGKNNLL